MRDDRRLVALLGDIGVWGFRDIFKEYPERIYNIGILEQSTIGVASGLAMAGFIPVIHTIAPFLVERAYEQLKLDFGYQNLNGNFVSVGGSYDYAALGCTHHCPGDIGALKNIPNMSIVIPGTAEEFDTLFKQAYKDDSPTYFRLSEVNNAVSQPVSYGRAHIVKTGSKCTVVAVGTMLGTVLQATADMDVTVIYYTTLRPFDAETLRKAVGINPKIIVCEPYYVGGIAFDIMDALKPMPITIEHIGVPHAFLTTYGTMAQQDEALGLTPRAIREKVMKFIA